MPFSNSYNRSVANKVIGNARKDIEMKNKMYNDPASFVEPRSTQEYMSVQQPEIQGGSGNLAATSFDMGEEQKKVGGARINKARATRVAKALEGESKPMVVTEQVAVKPKRVRRAKTAPPEASGGDFNDVMKTVGNVVDTGVKVAKGVATVAPYVLPLLGLGKSGKPKRTVAHLSEWNSFVKKTREETGKSLKDTLKYIKENNLYKKKGKATTTAKKSRAPRPPSAMAPRPWAEGVIKPKESKTDDVKPEDTKIEGSGYHKTKKPRKTKEGGSSGGILINEVVEARSKGDVVPATRVEGGVPSLKVPKARAKKILTNK
jgi:hypothetical protein